MAFTWMKIFLLNLKTTKLFLAEVSEKALGPVKEQILPLQNQEARNIRKELEQFQVKIINFRA